MPDCAIKAAVFAIATVLVTAQTASGQGDADAAKGLLVEHCANCHAIPGYDKEVSPAVKAQSFQEIAADPTAYSDERLRKSLRQPHWPMAQFRLSAKDIDNILAYVAALRSDKQ